MCCGNESDEITVWVMWLSCKCVATGMHRQHRHWVSLKHFFTKHSLWPDHGLANSIVASLLLTSLFICLRSSGNRLVFRRKLLRKWLCNHWYIADLARGNIKIPSLIDISAWIWTWSSKSEFKWLLNLNLNNSCHPFIQIFRSAVRYSKRWVWLVFRGTINEMPTNFHSSWQRLSALH